MLPADRNPNYVETMAVATVTVLLGLLSLIAPLFFLAMILMPLPLAYLIVKRDLNQGLLALGLASLFILLAVGNIIMTLLILLPTGPPAVIIGLLIKNRATVEQSAYALMGWAIVAAGIILVYFYTVGVFGDTRAGELHSIVNQMSQHYLDSGTVTEAERQEFMQYTEQIGRLAQLFLPGSIIVWTYTATIGSFFIARRLLAGLGFVVPGGTSFYRWRLPWYSIWLVIAGLALTMAGEEFSLTMAGIIGKNVLFVSAFVFFVQGISVALYFYQVWSIARIIKIFLMVIVVVYMPFFILAIGVIEPVANLRRLNGSGDEGTKGG